MNLRCPVCNTSPVTNISVGTCPKCGFFGGIDDFLDNTPEPNTGEHDDYGDRS